jgi:hypothetical protein
MTYEEALKIKQVLPRFIKEGESSYEIWITPSITKEFQNFLNIAKDRNDINDSHVVKFSSNQDFVLQKVLFYSPYFIHEIITEQEINQLQNEK